MRYFGYGSNLHAADLLRWSGERDLDPGGIRAIGPTWLPDHEPVFHYRSGARKGGALSIRARRGRATPGVLFDMDERGWSLLDRKEGPKYARARCVVLRGYDEVEAVTYVVEPEHREPHHVAPLPEYVALVTGGLAAHGLPTAQVEDAARSLDPRPLPRSIFVYGTLMRGEVREALLGRCDPTSWTEAVTEGELVDLGEYPGLVAGSGRVRGELVELRDPGPAIALLDDVEDFHGYGEPASLYRRVLIEIESLWAWTYLYIGGGSAPRIAGGDWRRR